MPVLTILLRKATAFLLTLAAVSAVVFGVMNVLPGDPAVTILGIEATPEALAALRTQLGLDAPAWQRYLGWIAGMIEGDLGNSFSFHVPVTELIGERLPLTLSLAVGATVLTIVSALALGAFAAVNHHRPGDWAVTMISQLGIAVPVFWFSMLLVLLFAVNLRWLPSGGFPGWDDPVAALRSLVLPTVSLCFVQTAILARVVRTSVLEVMQLDYVRTARSLGYSRRHVLWRHILPNALIPIVTIAGMQFAAVVTGTIVIENVFYLPGLGRLAFQAISNRDLITVQALVLFFAAIVVATNFLVDLLYLAIDPRLRGDGD